MGFRKDMSLTFNVTCCGKIHHNEEINNAQLFSLDILHLKNFKMMHGLFNFGDFITRYELLNNFDIKVDHMLF